MTDRPQTNFEPYDFGASASIAARKGDNDWFFSNRKAALRVRALRPGESPLVDALASLDSNIRKYAVVIHHARASDMRAGIEIGVYPLPVFERDKKTADAIARREGKRLARHFGKSRSTPPPTYTFASMFGVSHGV